MSATHDSSFNFKVNTTGSGNESTDAKSISAGQHIVVLAWNYDELPASGSITYSKDGAGAVSAGAPVQVRSRSGNSDRGAAWVIRNPGAGSYVINSVGLDYVGLSAHVFNAKANFWIRASSGAAGEGTGTTFTSGSVTPRFSSSIAYGYWTHNSHAGSASMTVPGGWTLAAGPNTVVHKAENYAGASQPGGCAYRNITDTGDPKTPITFAPTCSDNNNYLSLLLIISEPDTEYLVMGGTIVTAADPPQQGYFGRESAGGSDGTDRVSFAQDITTDDGVRTIGAPVLAGQLLMPVMGLYGGDAETTDFTLDGASNDILKDVQAAWGSGSPASATCFSCLTEEDCDYVEYNGPGSGDAKRYGQFGCYVTERPDPLTYRSVTGVARAVDGSHATIDPGGVTPLVPDTDLCFVIFVGTNQGHSSDLLPLVYDDTNFLPALSHSQLNEDEGVPDANTTGATHNSDHNSGWWLGRVYTAGTSYAPTMTFDATTGYSRSVLMAYNLAGGSPVGGGTEIEPAAAQLAFSGSAPTRLLQHLAAPLVAALTLSATAPAVAVTGHVSVSPATAQLSLSPAAPNVLQDYRPAPASGQLLFSGTAPTLTTAHLPAAPAGQLALSTTAPTALQQHLPASAAAQLVFSTDAPSVLVTISISPSAGQLTLDTTAPVAVQDHRPAPTAGQLTFSSAAPSLGNQVNITPDAGQLALSTTAPTRVVAHLAAPAGGDLALSGAAPSVVQDHRPAPSAAQLTFSTTAPSLGGATNITPDAGQMALSAIAPSAVQDHRPVPASADLTLTTTAPALGSGLNITVDAGVLTLSTSAPVVMQAHMASPAEGQLVLSGYAPTANTPPEYTSVEWTGVTLRYAGFVNVTIEPTT